MYDLYEIPDGINPLVGYRGWIHKDGKLYSCYREVEWPSNGRITSECIHPNADINLYFRLGNTEDPSVQKRKYSAHFTPDIHCSCGVYALSEYPSQREALPWPSESLTGVMLGWGHVVMGTKGFRSEYGKIVALVARPRSPKLTDIIEQVAFNYDIPIVSLKDVRSQRNEHR